MSFQKGRQKQKQKWLEKVRRYSFAMEWNLVMLDFPIAAPFKLTPWEGILTTAENATSSTANMSPRTGVAGTVSLRILLC